MPSAAVLLLLSLLLVEVRSTTGSPFEAAVDDVALLIPAPSAGLLQGAALLALGLVKHSRRSGSKRFER